MAPDEFKNLGFPEDSGLKDIPSHAGGVTTEKSGDNKRV